MQRRYSVAKVEAPQTYEQGKPKLNGLSDPRLGTMDRAIKCTTDGASQQDSPGYFGHIELAKPVFHIGFLTTVLKVLRCVSYHSSKLLIEKVRIHYTPLKSCLEEDRSRDYSSCAATGKCSDICDLECRMTQSSSRR